MQNKAIQYNVARCITMHPWLCCSFSSLHPLAERYGFTVNYVLGKDKLRLKRGRDPKNPQGPSTINREGACLVLRNTEKTQFGARCALVPFNPSASTLNPRGTLVKALTEPLQNRTPKGPCRESPQSKTPNPQLVMTNGTASLQRAGAHPSQVAMIYQVAWFSYTIVGVVGNGVYIACVNLHVGA